MMMRLILTLLSCLTPATVLADGDHGAHNMHASQTVAIGTERLALPNLPVTDRWGRQAGFRDTIGNQQSIIMGFVYTDCKTLCGMTNVIFSVIDAELVAGTLTDTKIVTVMIDPIRDTPQAIRAEAEELSASEDWLWLTGGPKGTRPLLETLRFPPGPPEDHDLIFLVGRPCLGAFTRVVGVPDPEKLIALARAQPLCTS